MRDGIPFPESTPPRGTREVATSRAFPVQIDAGSGRVGLKGDANA